MPQFKFNVNIPLDVEEKTIYARAFPINPDGYVQTDIKDATLTMNIARSDPHTLLLLHGESIEDSSKYKVPLTNNGVQVSTVKSKFGGKSLYFDGVSGILIPNGKIVLGNLKFTIDWWENCEAMGPLAGIRYNNNYNEPEGWGGLAVGRQISDIAVTPTVNSSDKVENALSVTVGKWVHWAVIKNGTKLTTYRNGTLFKKATVAGTFWNPSQAQSAIGLWMDPSNFDDRGFKGYIDEFRISDVVRWTSNFKPPTKPYV